MNLRELLVSRKLAGGNGGNSGGGGGESGDVSAADVLRSVIDRSITEISDSTITSVGKYAFYGCDALTTATLPNLTSVADYGFQFSGLTSVDFPKLANIGQAAFRECQNLKTVTLKSATSLPYFAFCACKALESVSAPKVTTIDTYAFQNCTALTIADCESVTMLNGSAFDTCSELVTFNAPNLETIGGSAFRQCRKLENIDLSNVTTIGQQGLYRCKIGSRVFPKLQTLGNTGLAEIGLALYFDFHVLNSIGSGAFGTCTRLKTVIIRSETVCSLANSDAFKSTPFTNLSYDGRYGGKLVVPRALTTEYSNDTNWSAVLAQQTNNKVLALEDFTVDGTLTGAIDWDKLNAA